MQHVREIRSIVRCSLILIQAFVAHFKTSKSFFRKHFVKQPFGDAESHFSLLMSLLIPEKLDVVIGTIMEFLRTEQLWRVECVCSEIFRTLLFCQAPPEILLDQTLDYIEDMIKLDRNGDSLHAVRVLHLIVGESFATMTEAGVHRLLYLYHLSVAMEGNQYFLLRTGFKAVLVKLLRAISACEIAKLFPEFIELTFHSNLTKIEMKYFGLTLRNGIARLKALPISQNLKPEILKSLLDEMKSDCDIKSFIATLYLSLIMDHYNNYERFSSPMIFHEHTSYDITKGSSDDIETRNIIESFRDSFEKAIITLIKIHSVKRDNLNAIYSLMCVIIVNVPCGFMVTFVVCILMNLQKYLITESQNLDQVQLNHLHAMIASILTLICWVTRAKSLTKYVHGVINLRYDSAPHLNPPVMDFYQYADHHLHHKNELFFDSWELRYCLWKHFRLDEEKLPQVTERIDHQEESWNAETFPEEFEEKQNL